MHTTFSNFYLKVSMELYCCGLFVIALISLKASCGSSVNLDKILCCALVDLTYYKARGGLLYGIILFKSSPVID